MKTEYVPDLPNFGRVDVPGFLVRSIFGAPGLTVDMICRTFRDYAPIFERFEIELTYIDWGE